MKNEKRVSIRKVIDVITSLIVGIITPIFFISFAAFIPCFFRPFYYMLIDPLRIPQSSGYSKATIIEAYDDVMDFIWLNKEFKTGSLHYTEEEKMHFEDCVPLFHLQLILLIVTSVLLVTYFILVKKKVLKTYKPGGIHPSSIGGMASLGLLTSIGIFAMINFDLLFTLFHKIFFPGKDNWTFDYETEEIINILPEEFFLVCAIFIISVVVLLSIGVIVVGLIFKHKAKKNPPKLENSGDII